MTLCGRIKSIVRKCLKDPLRSGVNTDDNETRSIYVMLIISSEMKENRIALDIENVECFSAGVLNELQIHCITIQFRIYLPCRLKDCSIVIIFKHFHKWPYNIEINVMDTV